MRSINPPSKVTESEKSDNPMPNQTKLLNVMAAQIHPLMDDPKRKERANESIFRTLTRHLIADEAPLPAVENTDEQERQAGVLSAYIALSSMQSAFNQCEYYFRRFPFSGLPVTHADHLRNVCEMYFDRIEQFRDRLKRLMNVLKDYTGEVDERYGGLVREYGKAFKWECKQRNLTHHQRRFEYDAIDQLGLLELLGKADEIFGQARFAAELPDRTMIYRQEARKWTSRVKNHTKVLNTIVEFSAGLVLEKCAFLDSSANLESVNGLKHRSTPDRHPQPGSE